MSHPVNTSFDAEYLRHLQDMEGRMHLRARRARSMHMHALWLALWHFLTRDLGGRKRETLHAACCTPSA
jgi:hypothetical protein